MLTYFSMQHFKKWKASSFKKNSFKVYIVKESCINLISLRY